jgi:hypothetical protein
MVIINVMSLLVYDLQFNFEPTIGGNGYDRLSPVSISGHLSVSNKSSFQYFSDCFDFITM